MSIQRSVAARNGALDSFETVVGPAPILEMRSGSPPANCAAADTGTLLASMTLPSDWMAAASGGTKAKAGTWQDPAADADGTVGHYRIWDSARATCHEQGTVTITGGGGDLQVDDVTFVTGQPITVTSYVYTASMA